MLATQGEEVLAAFSDINSYVCRNPEPKACKERVGQGEMGGVTVRVLCTWWLLGLALKRPCMVGTRRATPHPDCMDRLRKHYSHLAEGWFWQERLLGL